VTGENKEKPEDFVIDGTQSILLLWKTSITFFYSLL
jgi:hypothetical protein